MPYARPLLTQLRDQAVQDVNAAQITGSGGTTIVGLLQKAVLRVMAYVQAGFAYLHYGYLDVIAKQSVPFTATGEFMLGWAALKGITPEAAAFASGTITLPGSVGAAVPLPTGFTRSDGATFTSTAAVTVASGGTAAVPVTADVAGAAGNCDAGTSFRLSASLSNIQGTGTAAAAFTGGADLEADSSVRTRMLQAYAAPPQGGDREDYIEWLAVPGVTRAWIAPNGGGAGTVWLYVMLDVTESAHAGFPQGTNGVATNETRDTAAAGDQLTVANAVFAKQPVTALVYVLAPVAAPQNFTVANLGANNTSAMQAAITAALTDMFLRLGNVGGTVQPMDGSAWPAIQPDAWYEALGAISGLTQFDVTGPAAPIAVTAGQLPTLGTVTFST